jgi:succinoglycan biosynthesis transport protein ExoP
MSSKISGGEVPATAKEVTTAAAAPIGKPYPVVHGDGLRDYRDDEVTASFLNYFGLLLKYRMLVVLISASFLFGGFIITFLMSRIYTATTTVQIDREATKVIRIQDAAFENNDPQFYTTQYELLKSRALAERVVSSLSLANKPEFMGINHSVWGRILQQLFGQKDDGDPVRLQERAVDLLIKDLTIHPITMSRLVKVSFSSRSPAIAQLVSTAVAENFVGMTLDRRYGASAYARNFLEEKLQQVKLKLEESEKQIVAYAQRENIVNVDEKISVAAASLKALNDSLAAATSARIKEEQLWLQAQNGNGFGLPQVLEDSSIKKARERRAELAASYQEKLGIMKPDYPEMKQIRNQIAEYDRQIKGQIDLIKQAIKARYEAARDQEASFIAKTEKLKADVLDLRERSIQYNILQREVDTNRSLYEGLLQQFKEVGISGAIGTNNVSIVDKAKLPRTPSSPILWLNLAVSIFLGFIASGATIAVREFLDDTFKAPEEIEEALGIAALGIIPLWTKETQPGALAREVIQNPLSGVAEAYRSLRTSLQFSTASGAPKTLLVTSAEAAEGKSTTSVCVAANFAQLGMRVLLIDADMRRPSLHEILGCTNSVGLANVLTGSQDATDVVWKDLVEGMSFIASGPVPPNPAELLAGPRFASLLTTARENFDIIVIDSPPVMALADAPLLGNLVDGALLVVHANRTRRRVVRAAVKRLYYARTHVLGGLLNRFDAKVVGHFYGYGYGANYYGLLPDG